MVSVLAFSSDDPSSNLAEACNFFCRVFGKNENKQKRGWGCPPPKKKVRTKTKHRFKLLAFYFFGSSPKWFVSRWMTLQSFDSDVNILLSTLTSPPIRSHLGSMYCICWPVLPDWAIIELWATFLSLWQQLICPNLSHS